MFPMANMIFWLTDEAFSVKSDEDLVKEVESTPKPQEKLNHVNKNILS